ncbi:nuclear transport factor 2 family protein [Elongatibacter sediminis]|uniref:Nuclear transport factor 2 family protein n=1 Tax=Elongatibacter sediminis TaxID=3119006 RepID=A0AAW9RKJ0_9GAMM
MSGGQRGASEADRLQVLWDERDIRSVLLRYATALDQRDWSMLSSCFVPEASAEYETIGLLEGYPAIESICRTALQPMSVTQHLIGNIAIQVDGDEATSSCYLHAQHVRPDTPGGDSNIIAGEYVDEWTRTPEGWRIRHRKLRVLWTFGNPEIHQTGDT